MSTETPQWKLRRLAPRAKRIVQRRGGDSAALQVYAQSVPPKADGFCALYDQAAKYATAWRREMDEGKAAVSALVKAVRAWLPLVARDVPGFDRKLYLDQAAVPDDVLEDSERLLSVIQDHRDAQGQALPYQAQALATLTPLLQAASKEWAEAEAADSRNQQLLASLRESATALQHELVALRRTLRAHTGTSDKDYQKLRAERAGLPDDEDDPQAPSPPAPAQPAPAGAATPTQATANA